jgi:heptaprenylglyceryl phosphate synthase
MRKTRALWGQDAVQIGGTLRNSETELLHRRTEIAKNFQIKIHCFRTDLVAVLRFESKLQVFPLAERQNFT